jgi:hypothetical protein
MTKQKVLDNIKLIESAMGLSGFFSSLSKEFKKDVEVLKALRIRRKEL